jgi:DHA2 family methylenomycin A resistance protein-like MFS transporter
LGWRTVFFVNIPIGLICFILTAKFINPIVHEKKVKFDIAGQLFGITSIAALAFSLIETGRFGWNSFIVIIGFCVFIISLLMFILIEVRSKTPMLPLAFFKTKIFSGALIVGVMINLGFYGELFILPLYF